MLLHEGTIYNKWSNATLPDEYVLTDRLEQIPLGQLESPDDILTMSYVLLWFVLPLLLVTLIDALWMRSRRPSAAVASQTTDTDTKQ